MPFVFDLALRARRAALVSVFAAMVVAPASAAGWKAHHRLTASPESDESQAMPTDQPSEAERFFLKQRLAPGMKEFPVERLLQGREHARHMRLRASAAGRDLVTPDELAQASSLTWTALGPGNIGGRTRVLKFDPGNADTVYVAGV